MRQETIRSRSALALLALLVVVVAGCGRNGGNAPAGYTPQGTGSSDILTVEVLHDSGAATSSVRVRIYDSSRANGFGLYRRLPGQGFDRIAHVPLRFDGTFNQRVETFEAVDHDWQPNRQADYMGRGEFDGVETPISPLTNTATVPAADAPDSLVAKHIDIVCPLSTSSFTAKVDSVPVLVWSPVPGAVRYLVKIVRLDQHTYFYGFTPSDGSHSYQVGSGLGDILHELPLTLTSFFYWSVEGVDAQSRVVGRSDLQNFQVRTIAQSDSLIFCSP